MKSVSLWQTQIGNIKCLLIFDRFIAIFNDFLKLPNQIDLSAYCFYHFATSNVPILRCNNTLIFLWRFQCKNLKLGNLMENPLFRIDYLNDQNTLEISPSHF